MSNEPYTMAGQSAGFEIGRQGPLVILGYRATRAPALVAWIAGGLAGMAGIHAVLWPALAVAGTVGLWPGVITGIVLAPVAAALFVISRAGYRRYCQRRDLPIEKAAGYRVRLDEGQLLMGTHCVAKTTDVVIGTPLNIGDSTQGSMRWVRLTWSQGNARVYSANKSEAERIAALLVEWGVGHRH